MATKQLDRNRYYAQVYGDSNKKFYQDGIYFDGGGNAMNSGKQAVPKKPEAEAAVTPAEPKEPQKDNDALEELKTMKVVQLKKVAKKVSEATGKEPERWTGKGIADVLREFIISNTE